MKKTIVTASIISAALFLSACGETAETPVDSSAEKTTTPVETEQTETEQTTEQTTIEPAKEETAPASPVEEPAEETVDPPVEETIQPDESSKYTMGQLNAIGQAENYLDFTAFSRTGLIEQLVYEAILQKMLHLQ
ncbi:Ltp family lipoprotein [Niallia sp. Krafla_26]|uniref:Ltp family lipoprotein n=1 Tax=Niallia sp. Krafla_26 TaxID=3064703 RepID=UPI003D164E15